MVLAALLSTFLTNDVALFIVVPLTITLKNCAIPVNRLIIFEALAVNAAGSLLTPIGNPQNIRCGDAQAYRFQRVYLANGTACGAMMLTLVVLCWFSSLQPCTLSYQYARA